MNKLKLLPRWCRFLGLGLILPAIIIFANYPDIILGDSKNMGDFVAFFDSHLMTLFEISHEEGREVYSFFTVIENNVLNEILLVMMVLGSYLVAFAKVKEEDEFTRQLRTQSMIKALIVNFILLLVLNFLIFDLYFLLVLNFQLFSYLLIFSVIFALKIRKQRRVLGYEE